MLRNMYNVCTSAGCRTLALPPHKIQRAMPILHDLLHASLPATPVLPAAAAHAMFASHVAHASNLEASQTSTPVVKKYKLRSLTTDDVDCSFARSGGAGGQNVNKVNTKVDMRFDLDKHDWIPDEIKEEIRRAEKNRFTKEGILVITSQKHRTQIQNIDDALTKLQEVLDNAVIAVTPKEVDPETIKRVKASIEAGQKKRLDNKKKDSMKKKERSRRDWD